MYSGAMADVVDKQQRETHRTQLRAGIDTLNLAVTDDMIDQMLTFMDLLARWNRTHNLTAVASPSDMITRHLLDALAVLPHIGTGRLLDVGSGAGLPGFALAVARPALAFTSLDARNKKVQFQRYAAGVLGLQNVRVVHARVEGYRDTEGFDTVICRGLTTLKGFVDGARHLCRPAGRLLAMKGVYPESELAELAESGSGAELEEVIELTVPGLTAKRHLVILRPALARASDESLA